MLEITGLPKKALLQPFTLCLVSMKLPYASTVYIRTYQPDYA